MSDTIIVTAWKGGDHRPSGAGYGVKMSKTDRDRLVERKWNTVTVELPDGTTAVTNVDGMAFWSNGPELRSRDIGRWMYAAGFAPWPNGNPPKFRLELVAPARVRVLA